VGVHVHMDAADACAFGELTAGTRSDELDR
jgi:hypothetical protein